MWISWGKARLGAEASLCSASIRNHLPARHEVNMLGTVPIFLPNHDDPEWSAIPREIEAPSDVGQLPGIKRAPMRFPALLARRTDEPPGCQHMVFKVRL
jgi:hypothetical protein